MSLDDFTSNFAKAVTISFIGARSRVLRPVAKAAGTEAPDPRLSLIVFLDHVHLLVQHPCYFTVTLLKSDSGKIISQFSSLSPQDRAFWAVPPLLQDKLDEGKLIASTCLKEENKKVQVTLCSTHAAQSLPRGVQRLLELGVKELLKSAAPYLRNALLDLKANRMGNHIDRATVDPKPVVATDLWKRQFEYIQERLDPILNSYGTCDLFPRDKAGRSRLFAAPREPFTDDVWSESEAVRRVSGQGGRDAKYGYSAGLFLTPTQREERSEILDTDFKLPKLGQGDRAIADTTLTSGVVDFGMPTESDQSYFFGRYVRTSLSPEKAGEIREKENLIYGFDPDIPEGIFYAPFHISGIPWLTLFSFHDFGNAAEGDKDWRYSMWRRYHIYRDVFPIIAEEVSQALMQAFADNLAHAARRHLDLVHDARQFADRLNREWEGSSTLLPYGTVHLCTEGASDRGTLQLRLSGRKRNFHLSVVQEESGFSWRQLDPGLFARLMELRLQGAIEDREEGRLALIGNLKHDWVHRLSDGVAILNKVKETALTARVNDEYMAYAYALEQTLRNYLGLWIRESQDHDLDKYFGPAEVEKQDIEFLRAVFELHARIRLLAHTGRPVTLQFMFCCESFDDCNDDKTLCPSDLSSLAKRGLEIGIFLKHERAPWPFSAAANEDLDMCESLLWKLIAVPVEILRNAITHGAEEHGTEEKVPPGITFSLDVRPDQSRIVATAANPLAQAKVLSGRLQRIKLRCENLNSAFGFVECSVSYDEQLERVAVTCDMKFRREDHA